MFFTFWGLMRWCRAGVAVEKNLVGGCRLMMPRGADKLAISDEHGRYGPCDDQGHYEEEERRVSAGTDSVRSESG